MTNKENKSLADLEAQIDQISQQMIRVESARKEAQALVDKLNRTYAELLRAAVNARYELAMTGSQK